MPNIQAIAVGLKELQAFMKNVNKQTRFATARAINETAKDVQQHELEKELPDALTLRSRGKPWYTPGTKFGVNIRPFANKNSLQAVVGSQANWLKLQEDGGVKQRSQGVVAIPLPGWKPHKDIIAKAKKPRRLLSAKPPRIPGTRGRPFITTSKAGNSGIFVAERDGGLRMLFIFKPSVKVSKRLQFEKSGETVVQRVYQRNFAEAWRYAIRTAR